MNAIIIGAGGIGEAVLYYFVTRRTFDEIDAFHTSGGASTLPYTYLRRVRELDYKTIRYPGPCAAIKPLLDLGLASEDDVSIGGPRIKPRDVPA